MKKNVKTASPSLDRVARALDKALDALDPDLVSAVLAAGVDLKGKGAVARAAKAIKTRTSTEVLSLLLDAGADPNEPAPGTTTPALCYALLNRNIAWTEALLKAGANPNDRRPAVGPLATAFNARIPALVALLRQHGADPLQCANPSWWADQKADVRAWYERARASADADKMDRELSREPKTRPPAKRQRF